MPEAISPDFWHAVEQFNRSEFYACHDSLEEIWHEAIEPNRTFYQGILQLAVSLHHLENHNWRGAVMLLGEGIRRLRDYEPDYGDINVSLLVQLSEDLLAHLQVSGADQVAQIAENYFKATRQRDRSIAALENSNQSTIHPLVIQHIR